MWFLTFLNSPINCVEFFFVCFTRVYIENYDSRWSFHLFIGFILFDFHEVAVRLMCFFPLVQSIELIVQLDFILCVSFIFEIGSFDKSSFDCNK